ncbi:hypothetical protein GGR50DRAFT_678251, partial [Xylaria sp. CBS 124048]
MIFTECGPLFFFFLFFSWVSSSALLCSALPCSAAWLCLSTDWLLYRPPLLLSPLRVLDPLFVYRARYTRISIPGKRKF